MIKLWFNHWFSTSYRLIELMKDDADEKIYVIGSNLCKNSVIQRVCDEWYEEPNIEGEEYLEYCLNFCKSNSIDVFVPGKEMKNISKNIQKFKGIGVKVLLDDYDIVSVLGDKVLAYEYFKDTEGINVPEYYKVNNVTEFKKAYKMLKDKDYEVCVKFVEDKGGMSFRRLTDGSDELKKIKSYAGASISCDEYLRILEGIGEFDDLMIMPYLEGNEISIDCLNTSKGLIAVPRDKGNSRDERVFYDEKILNMVEIILKKIDIKYPFNVQFKYKKDMLYLLEINTRMSGGLQMSCLAADVNIPNIALNKLIGKEIEWKQKKQETIVSYIELPYIIK